MGRLAVFNDQQIIDAGLSIEAESKSVSTFAIRNKLNGGSSDRIKSVWEAFLANRDKGEIATTPTSKMELPPNLQELLDKNISTQNYQFKMIVMESFKLAQSIAESQIKAVFDEYKAKIKIFEESEIQASLALENSDKKIEELETELEAMTLETQKLLALFNKNEGVIETLNQRVQLLEIKETEFNKLQREFGKLEAQLQTVK